MQVVRRRKIRTLRTLNNQHFHSALCNLWITPARGGTRRVCGRGFNQIRNRVGGLPRPEPSRMPTEEREARILQLDITPVLVHALLLRIQALLLPIQTLVLSGH